MPVVVAVSLEYDLMSIAILTDPSIEESIITEQIYDDVRKMIDFLPPEEKAELHMRMYSEMSFKDIAEATNVSINTALGRMRYALINMRKMVKEKDLVLTIK